MVGPLLPRQNGLAPVSLTELTATSRVTVFPLEELTVAYTTHSSDSRGLGDIGLVTVVDEQSDGEELWRLARDLGGRTQVPDQARWILTQASRARVVTAYADLPDAKWTAHIRRRVVLDTLFANHEILMTGRIAGASLSCCSRPEPTRSGPPHSVAVLIRGPDNGIGVGPVVTAQCGGEPPVPERCMHVSAL
ncbi:hypothetical protein QFZ66_005404 [Streptomyces sp. B4I13]|nr:hypothetical protein [Streptomyces sp. B4I13]